jgi:hypothetical protein
MEKKKRKSAIDDEWEKRTLCSDPACIGVIGPDGRCKECGKPYEGKASDDRPFSSDTPEPEPDTEAEEIEVEEIEVEETESAVEEEEETIADDEWNRRTLCSDPACIGVIGPDGRCKECGNPYSDESNDTVE